jgi:trehalose/maltose hydrolase-like predicted phosphorylase
MSGMRSPRRGKNAALSVQSKPMGAVARGLERRGLTRRGYDAAVAARDESLFALANGTLGLRGGWDDALSASDCTYLAGLYERAPLHYHERFKGFAAATDVRLPIADGRRVLISCGGHYPGQDSAAAASLMRVLDLDAGTLTQSFEWAPPGQGRLLITRERLVCMDRPGAAVVRIRIRSLSFDGALEVESLLTPGAQALRQGDDPRIGVALGGGGLDTVDLAAWAAKPGLVGLGQTTRHSGLALAIVQDQVLLDGAGVRIAWGAAKASTFADTGGRVQTAALRLRLGETATIEKFIAYAWAQSVPDSAEGVGRAEVLRILACDAETLAQALAQEGWERLAARQAAYWADFWRNTDLDVAEGTQDGGCTALEGAGAALRFNLFHLCQSASRIGMIPTAAKGLTGEGYEGHCFWDTETFILPVMAFVAPAVARAMLDYRIGVLDKARMHAALMGHGRGALFPWRTIAGAECSAHYPSGSAQYHINADIAFALRLYVQVTGDRSILKAGGAELLFETARIWLAIGHFNPARAGAFTLHGVTGPDEYSALVDNDYYTNAMAQAHLLHAATVHAWLGEHEGDFLADLARRINLAEDEPQEWQRAGRTMWLPVDAQRGVHPQDDGFLDKPLWDFANTPDSHYPLLLHYHPLALYRRQVCKQADVVLANILAGDETPLDLKGRDFDYYEAVTVHDSTLSASSFAIMAAEIGRADQALDYWRETVFVDLDDLHGNSGHGMHMAALAGGWLSLIWGFAGLRWQEAAGALEGSLRLAPCLPSAWQSYRFALQWQGQRLTVEVDGHRVHYRLLAGSPLILRHHGRLLRISAQTTTVAAIGADLIALPGPLRGLILDLDGVLTDTAEAHFLESFGR